MLYFYVLHSVKENPARCTYMVELSRPMTLDSKGNLNVYQSAGTTYQTLSIEVTRELLVHMQTSKGQNPLEAVINHHIGFPANALYSDEYEELRENANSVNHWLQPLAVT